MRRCLEAYFFEKERLEKYLEMIDEGQQQDLFKIAYFPSSTWIVLTEFSI